MNKHVTIYLPKELKKELTEWNNTHKNDGFKINISHTCRLALEKELRAKQ